MQTQSILWSKLFKIFHFFPIFQTFSCLLAINTQHGFYIMWRSLQLLQRVARHKPFISLKGNVWMMKDTEVLDKSTLSNSTEAGDVFTVKYDEYKMTLSPFCLSMVLIYIRSTVGFIAFLTSDLFALLCQTSTWAVGHLNALTSLQLPDQLTCVRVIHFVVGSTEK